MLSHSSLELYRSFGGAHGSTQQLSRTCQSPVWDNNEQVLHTTSPLLHLRKLVFLLPTAASTRPPTLHFVVNLMLRLRKTLSSLDIILYSPPISLHFHYNHLNTKHTGYSPLACFTHRLYAANRVAERYF